MRLDKYLTMAGFGSRKEVKKAIRSKKVKVNDQIIIADDYHINPATDLIFYEQWQVDLLLEVYIMLNKPKGVVSATTDSLHATVLDCIDISLPSDVFPIGRLDIDTEGLLLLTNDGELALKLTHPRYETEKVYQAWLHGIISEEKMQQFREGLQVDDYVTLPADIRMIEKQKDRCLVEIVLREGRNRQVRKMCESLGYPVSLLKRVAIGQLTLGDLKPGQWRVLTSVEVKQLMDKKGRQQSMPKSTSIGATQKKPSMILKRQQVKSNKFK